MLIGVVCKRAADERVNKLPSSLLSSATFPVVHHHDYTCTEGSQVFRALLSHTISLLHTPSLFWYLPRQSIDLPYKRRRKHLCALSRFCRQIVTALARGETQESRLGLVSVWICFSSKVNRVNCFLCYGRVDTFLTRIVSFVYKFLFTTGILPSSVFVFLQLFTQGRF